MEGAVGEAGKVGYQGDAGAAGEPGEPGDDGPVGGKGTAGFGIPGKTSAYLTLHWYIKTQNSRPILTIFFVTRRCERIGIMCNSGS